MNAPTGFGVAFVCDGAGVIREIARDDLGVSGFVKPGMAFLDVLDAGSRAKGGAFLEQVRTDGAAFRWELNVNREGSIDNLYFAGGVVNANLILLGAESEDEASRFYSDLLAINNEQSNLLRAAIKDRAQVDQQARKNLFLYEELTRLNSEMANVQRELHKKNKDLEHTNQQKDLLLGMAAHDLRNPLGVIMSYSSYLEEALADSLAENYADMLRDIHSSSRFMLGLVDSLLDVSQVESGKLQLDLKRTDMGRLCRHTVRLNRELAKKRFIALRYDQGDDVPEVMIDPDKMVQVVNNLITNAVKYSPSRTVVQVRLERRGDDLLLSVSDMGPGIKPEDRERIFRPYTRLEEQSDSYKSAGLGLAIVNKIVNGHKGRIWVEGDEGRGATFNVMFPIVLPEALAEGEAPLKAGAWEAKAPEQEDQDFHKVIRSLRTQDTLRVLVVEDDPVNSRMLKRFLEMAGHEPVCADSGDEALEVLRGQAFDLVLMDHHMENMTGVETVQAIRGDTSGELDPAVPVIALTGQSGREGRELFIQAGADDFLSKPIDRKDLYTAIDAVAAKR